MKLLPRLFSLCLIIAPLFAISQTYNVEEITVKPLNSVIHRTGKLAFKRILNLSFKSSGFLTELTVDEGDYFDKGQLLASVDTTELVESKNSTYAQLLQTKSEVSRIKKLIEKGLSSSRDFDVANTNLKMSRAAYKVALYDLEKSQVIAPFSGVVLARKAELGQLMTPGLGLLQVAALKNNWVVKVALTGREVSQIHLQQKAVVHLHTLGKIEGVINKIPATSNTEGNLFMIDILLPLLLKNSGVIAGQIADVTIEIVNDDLFVYQLPIEALMAVNDEGKALVTTVSGSKSTSPNGYSFSQKAFDVFKLDNNFVYLRANNTDKPIQIVTHGWQHLSASE